MVSQVSQVAPFLLFVSQGPLFSLVAMVTNYCLECFMVHAWETILCKTKQSLIAFIEFSFDTAEKYALI